MARDVLQREYEAGVDEGRRQMRAEVERLRGLLRRAEWGEVGPFRCAVCWRTQSAGHAPGCELAAALEAPDGD